jgi:hypothetical protein
MIWLVLDFGLNVDGNYAAVAEVREPREVATRGAEILLAETPDAGEDYCSTVLVVPIDHEARQVTREPVWCERRRTYAHAELQCCGGLGGSRYHSQPDRHTTACEVASADEQGLRL